MTQFASSVQASEIWISNDQPDVPNILNDLYLCFIDNFSVGKGQVTQSGDNEVFLQNWSLSNLFDESPVCNYFWERLPIGQFTLLLKG